MRPTLLCIDTKQGKATRYWPKLGDQRPATFLTQEAAIYQLDGVWQLGGEEGLAILEQFRAGKLNVAPAADKQPEAA